MCGVLDFFEVVCLFFWWRHTVHGLATSSLHCALVHRLVPFFPSRVSMCLFSLFACLHASSYLFSMQSQRPLVAMQRHPFVPQVGQTSSLPVSTVHPKGATTLAIPFPPQSHLPLVAMHRQPAPHSSQGQPPPPPPSPAVVVVFCWRPSSPLLLPIWITQPQGASRYSRVACSEVEAEDMIGLFLVLLGSL